MDRRSFLQMSPALPVAAVSASLVLHEEGKADISVDVSVLKTQPGDVLVITTPDSISHETAERLKAHVEQSFPGLRAMVFSDGLKVEGVIRSAG